MASVFDFVLLDDICYDFGFQGDLVSVLPDLREVDLVFVIELLSFQHGAKVGFDVFRCLHIIYK